MSKLEKLPYFLSYFLGYRRPESKQKSLPLWRAYLWSFLAAWIGIALLEIIFTYSPSFKEHHTPTIVASFGAGAVLVYGVLDGPLSQPRNVIGGQTIGSVVGVIIAQLFLGIQQDWSSEGQKTAVMWVAGATAMSTSLVLMQLTKTVHPPAGATALIATTTASIIEIKWFYIGVVFLSAVLQVTVGCLINNIERKYPAYWWKPEGLPIQVDPTNAATVVSFKKDSTRDLIVAEKGLVGQMKPEDSLRDDTSVILDRAISTLKIRSSKALSDQEHASFLYLLEKISSHPS